VITRCAGTDGALALPSKFESTVGELNVRGNRVKGELTLRDADCRAFAAGFGLELRIFRFYNNKQTNQQPNKQTNKQTCSSCN